MKVDIQNSSGYLLSFTDTVAFIIPISGFSQLAMPNPSLPC